MTEKQIEAWLRKMVHERGGMCLKFVSPGMNGVPDRIILSNGMVYFAELKSATGRLSVVQTHVISEMLKRGADVRVLKGVEEVERFVDEVVPVSAKGVGGG